MLIHYQLATTKKGSSSITEYFQSIKSMSDNLAVAEQHLNDFESVSYLLAGLGLEYDPFVTSVGSPFLIIIWSSSCPRDED